MDTRLTDMLTIEWWTEERMALTFIVVCIAVYAVAVLITDIRQCWRKTG